MEKLPPIEKVYEAWSAVADGRVELHPDERGLDAVRVEATSGARRSPPRTARRPTPWLGTKTARRTRRTTTPRTGKAMLATPSSPCSCCKAGFRSTALQPTGSRRWTGPISTSAASATTRPPCAPSSTSAASMPFESKRRRGKPSTPWARSTSSSNRGRPDRRSPRRREEEF